MEPSVETPTRVFVVDDHAMFAEALRLLEGGIGEPPDVVIMDLDLPGADGISATRRIRERWPDAKVVVLTAIQDPEVIAEALAAGACGYVPTPADDDLMDVARRAAAGELVMPEGDLAPLLQLLRDTAPRPEGELLLRRLTRRERDILRALADGETTSQVAERFGISALTVQSHVKNILSKLGVHSKIEAVTLVLRHGLAPTGEPV